MTDELGPKPKLIALFKETAEAHHEAFSVSQGEDPDWPIWYANYLVDRIGNVIDRLFTKTELIVRLVEADNEHSALMPKRPWAPFYADFFCERYDCAQDEKLALYYTPGCGFCHRVLRVIDELGVDVELRDIWADDGHRRDLAQARGRSTVPVLRCTSKDRDRWLPESRDIVRYLRERFA